MVASEQNLTCQFSVVCLYNDLKQFKKRYITVSIIATSPLPPPPTHTRMYLKISSHQDVSGKNLPALSAIHSLHACIPYLTLLAFLLLAYDYIQNLYYTVFCSLHTQSTPKKFFFCHCTEKCSYKCNSLSFNNSILIYLIAFWTWTTRSRLPPFGPYIGLRF